MLPPSRDSMPDWLHQRAQLSPERLALLFGDTRLSFRELDEAVEGTVSRLRAAGLAEGDVVALLGTNSVEYAVAVYAVSRVGGVLMPMNTRLTSAELAWQLEDAEARWLLHDTGQADVAGQLTSNGLLRLALDEVVVPQPSHLPEGEWIEARVFGLEVVQTIVYTSGTTGRPKGAMLTYGNNFWSAIGSALNLGVREDDRWLVCLPLFHVGGLSTLIKSVVYGMPVVLHEGFDPVRINRSIDEDGVTIISVVANMLQRMLDARGDVPYPPSLRCVLLGGGPAPKPLLEACAVRGIPVVQTYGLTEAASQVVTLAPEEALRRLGSAGKPLFGTEVRIERDDGSVCEASEEGEIVVRGPTVSPGYLNRPEDTARVIRDGWLHTGDAGYLDAEGYLYVLDRRDDLIVSGGENVYPAEIESVLQSHPAVLEAGVYGVDDERWGRAPAAAVVLRPGLNTTPDELVTYCRERLARYKVPSRVQIRDALPRNASGKLLRRELGK